MKLVVAGASGLVGGCFLRVAEDLGHDVVSVVRRPMHRTQEIITDFASPCALPNADAAICALGTTLKRAGSRRAFYAVDHDAVITFGEAAQRAGVRHFLLVSAVGANPRAAVYYSRVKGETERDLQSLCFDRIDIAQPGLLLGVRNEKRPVEHFLQAMDPIARIWMRGPLDRYSGIETETVARALLELCSDADDDAVFRHENRALRSLGKAI